MLIGAGADIAGQDATGQTPLHRFVYREETFRDADEHVPVLEALIAHGADINAQDHEGNTPLHLAAASETYVVEIVVNALLDAGADGALQNAKDLTPWDLATDNESGYLKQSEAYWRLNETRFEAVDGGP